MACASAAALLFALALALARVGLPEYSNWIHPVGLRGGQRVDLRCGFIRLVAGERGGKAHEFFAVPGLGLPRRIADLVGQAVIDGVEAGRIGIADPGGLHGRRAPGENLEAMVRRVAGEIDEQVDLIFADAVCGLVVVEPGDVAPVVGECA